MISCIVFANTLPRCHREYKDSPAQPSASEHNLRTPRLCRPLMFSIFHSPPHVSENRPSRRVEPTPEHEHHGCPSGHLVFLLQAPKSHQSLRQLQISQTPLRWREAVCILHRASSAVHLRCTLYSWTTGSTVSRFLGDKPKESSSLAAAWR